MGGAILARKLHFRAQRWEELDSAVIELTINGKPVALDRPLTIAQFLAARDLKDRMVVVEHNGEIVPRDRFAEVALNDGDNLEVVQMMAGG